MSKVGALAHGELTFVWLDGEPRLPEFSQDAVDVVDVVFPTGTVDYHVVEIGCCVARVSH